MEIDEITETIIDAAIAVHRELGPGLLGYRLELVVERSVILELKVVEQLSPIHAAQLLTYLKLSGRRVGLLINFNVRLLRGGLRRLVLDLPEYLGAPSVLGGGRIRFHEWTGGRCSAIAPAFAIPFLAEICASGLTTAPSIASFSARTLGW